MREKLYVLKFSVHIRYGDGHYGVVIRARCKYIM